MPYPELYDTNREILYPFVPPPKGRVRFQFTDDYVPDDFILDCGFWLGSSENYDPSEDLLYLDTLARAGTTLTIVFTSSSGASFTFTRDAAGTDMATEYVDADTGASAGIGFLVTGDLSIIDSVTDGATVQVYRRLTIGSVLESDATVEPALVQAESNSTVLSVNVGNLTAVADRPCNGCGDAAEIDTDTVHMQVDGTGLTGDVTFEGGYNAVVGIDAVSNVLVLQAAYGAGKGVLCGDPPSRYLEDDTTAGERCNELLYTVNGISPTNNGAFRLQGAVGMSVSPDVDNHKISIVGRIEQVLICSEGEET